MTEVPLAGGHITQEVVRVGETVHRTSGPGTSGVEVVGLHGSGSLAVGDDGRGDVAGDGGRPTR
jgi:hypothetical protein